MKYSICTGIALIFASLSLFAEPTVPPLSAQVMDRAGLLSAGERSSLEQYLRTLYRESGVQLVVFTLPSLEGADIDSFSLKAAESWGLGQRGDDRGVLLLIAEQEREARIEVGYGLEGQLTDAVSGQIIRNILFPHFRQGDYGAGITAAVTAIADRAVPGGAPLPEGADRVNIEKEEDSLGSSILTMMIILALIFAMTVLARKPPRRTLYYRRPSGGFFSLLPWFFLFGSGRRRRRFGDDDDSFGGFGGFGGGGSFGGGGGVSGGGGRFGGGGASGKW